MRQVILSILIAACFSLGGQAVYGATFGNATGTNNSISTEGRMNTGHFTLSEDGLATSMTIGLISDVNRNARGAIYRGSDSSLVGYTEVKVVPGGGTEIDITFNFYPPLRLFAGDYRLGVWTASGAGTTYVLNDAGGSGTHSYRTLTYSNQTYPIDFPTTYTTNLLDITCTYTPGTPLMFGDTTVGNSTLTIEDQPGGGTYISPPSTCRVDSCATWLEVTDIAGTTAKSIKMALYDSLSEDLIDTTYSRVINIDDNMDGHRVFHFAGDSVLSASRPVVLAVWGDTSSATYTVGYKSTTGKTVVAWSASYAGTGGVWADPHGGGKVTNGKVHVFAYCTAVSAGGFKWRKRRIDGMKQSFIWQEAQETFAGSNEDFVR